MHINKMMEQITMIVIKNGDSFGPIDLQLNLLWKLEVF